MPSSIGAPDFGNQVWIDSLEMLSSFWESYSQNSVRVSRSGQCSQKSSESRWLVTLCKILKFFLCKNQFFGITYSAHFSSIRFPETRSRVTGSNKWGRTSTKLPSWTYQVPGVANVFKHSRKYYHITKCRSLICCKLGFGVILDLVNSLGFP